jgi:Big-like domain-containing protein
LRDAQHADFRKNQIPPGAAEGSVDWIRLDNVPVTGRLIVISRNGGIASAYDCCTCPCTANLIGISDSPSTFSVLPGATMQCSCTATFQNCNGVDTYSTETNSATWSSSNTAVATMDGTTKGLVHGVAAGAATITATYSGFIYQTACQPQPCNVGPCQATPVSKSGSGTCDVIQVQVTNVSISSDQVSVTLSGPSGASGTLVVTWNGPSGNANIDNETKGPGSYTFNPSLSGLAAGQYTGVTATWTVGGAATTGSKTYNFNVFGTWRHSQYNTPTESQCTGSSSSAYEVNVTTCAYQTGNLISNFISQSWLNGSGITINSYYGYNSEQNAQYCGSHGYLPSDWSGKSFAFEPKIIPYCTSYSIGNATVAWNFSSTQTLNCGDQVLLVGYGSSPGTVKTVTDRCGSGCSNTQLDNYTTSAACAPGSFSDLGNFVTIRLGR